MKTIPMLFLISMMGLTACEEQGPAEELGENIDEATEETADAIRDATN